MSDHSTHKLDAYVIDRIRTVFCKVCSREGDLLSEPCPGKYVSMLDKTEKIDVVGISTVDKDRK